MARRGPRTRPRPPSPQPESEREEDADGSYDVYFAPKPPAGHEGNWVQAVPGKAWWVILGLYGPLQPWFDKTCLPGKSNR
ncbi:DUF1214 domain-containing protein [Variovorax sp. J22R115]|nr:DUF1214 domain-containing protein [Variovorax sp. J22R115]MDM0048844.1 DUF1214 domain-containing protein [Variovorax sp. J22R115]